MITRIYADNFRCLGDFEFRSQRLNLLLGENGSGKTSLVEILRRLKELVVGGASAPSLFAGEKTVWDPRDTQSFELDVQGAAGTFAYGLRIQHPPREALRPPQIAAERLDFEGRPLFRYGDGHVHLFGDDHSPGPVFPFKPEQSFLPNLEPQSSKLGWFKDFLGALTVLQPNPFALEAYTEHDERFLTVSGSNFASWLRYLSDEKPDARSECEEHLAEVIPGFRRFRFQAMGDRKALLADFARDGERHHVLFNELSEGQRILSLLYSVLYGLVGSASVLCFDEPENFISLPEVQPWLQSLRDLVEERSGQVLVISHHPEVIDYLAADSAFRFERPGGQVARVSPWIPDPSKIMKPSEILVREG